MINKEIIAQRKEQYGNNFPLISKLFNNYLQNIKNVDIVLTPEDVSILMGLMKISRLANSPHHEDSLVDLINYMWIAMNYDEYVSLEGSDKPRPPFTINKNAANRAASIIRNMDNLSRDINKTEHNSDDAIDTTKLSLSDFVLAYMKTKTLD
jgi:hypothetical protein